MTHFMAYVILLSAGVGACALLAEIVLRGRGAPTRWTWIAALASAMVVAGAATLAPSPEVREAPLAGSLSPGREGLSTTAIPVPAEANGADSMVQIADAVLPVAWPLASLFLLVAILHGQRRLHRERRQSESTTVHGREVLLTENSGPAVAGVGRPVVFLPRWVLALDARSQELLLAHEFEHVRRGDTRLLLVAAIGSAVMPWNPIVWWISRRLRLAVEQDCDARVLRAHPDVRRYADLLLMAAGQPTVSTRLLAAHFGEHRSDLDRRIQAMTDRRFRWRPALAAAALAGALLVASCEAPRPEPLAPRDGEKATPNAVRDNAVLDQFQVEKPVTMAAGSVNPTYPDILRQAGVQGEALVSFVVNEDGTADVASFKVIRTSHELFATAVKRTLPSMRFIPAEAGGKKVKQLVEQPFTFSIVGGQRTAATPSKAESALKFSTPPNVVVYSFDGTELARGEDLLQKIAPRTIHSVEVFRSSQCPATMTCPLIKIRLAEGKTLGPSAAVRPGREETAETTRMPRMAQEIEAWMAATHTVDLLSSTGELITRYESRAASRGITSEDIAASETLSGRSCKAGLPCPMTRIWLKPGRETAYKGK